MGLILFFALLFCGYSFGNFAEKGHYKDIQKREKQYSAIIETTTKTWGSSMPYSMEMVCGQVVISQDYFKKFLSSFRQFFGGNMASYETLLDRGKREAILRMKESAVNAKAIINIRLETAHISLNSLQRYSIGAVEVIAYGTAIYELPKAK